MLAEFLLTPDALADPDGRNGTDVVRELTGRFFPSGNTPLALVCKVGGEEWERATSRKIARISNHNHRNEAMALFQRLLTQSSVTRPAVFRSSDAEADWIEAGAKSASLVPVNKIIVSQNSMPPEKLGATVQEFVSDAFWDRLSNPRLVGRDVMAQEQVLRAICTHSDWLLMRLPQIRGGSDDEIVTVKQIIRLSNLLPRGFRKSAIDLHVCMKRALSEHNLTREISSELCPLVRKGIKIRLSVYPEGHFVNRELLGGECTKTSPGDIKRRPLWWITMTHVAVGSRYAANAGDAGNTWSLFPRHMAYERYEQMIRESPLRVEVLQ